MKHQTDHTTKSTSADTTITAMGNEHAMVSGPSDDQRTVKATSSAAPTAGIRRGIVVSVTEDQLQMLLDHLHGYEGARAALVVADLGEILDHEDEVRPDKGTWTTADPIDQLESVMILDCLEHIDLRG